MISRGVNLKFARTMSESLNSSILPVPCVSTWTETGSATPIAYASWISQRSAMPAATMFFAM